MNSVPRAHSEVQFVLSPTRVTLGHQINIVGYIILYCNSFVMLFTQIIHKKQTEK